MPLPLTHRARRQFSADERLRHGIVCLPPCTAADRKILGPARDQIRVLRASGSIASGALEEQNERQPPSLHRTRRWRGYRTERRCFSLSLHRYQETARSVGDVTKESRKFAPQAGKLRITFLELRTGAHTTSTGARSATTASFYTCHERFRRFLRRGRRPRRRNSVVIRSTRSHVTESRSLKRKHDSVPPGHMKSASYGNTAPRCSPFLTIAVHVDLKDRVSRDSEVLRRCVEARSVVGR